MVTIKASTIDSVNNFTLDGKEYLKKDYKTYYEAFETSQTGSIQVLTYIGIVGSNSNIAPLVYVQSPKRYSSDGVTGFADYATASAYLESLLAEPTGSGTGASSFSGLAGNIADGQVPESAVKQWETSLEIHASQLTGVVLGENNTINSTLIGEPSSAFVIPNIVGIYESDYLQALGNGSIVSTTYYIRVPDLTLIDYADVLLTPESIDTSVTTDGTTITTWEDVTSNGIDATVSGAVALNLSGTDRQVEFNGGYMTFPLDDKFQKTVGTGGESFTLIWREGDVVSTSGIITSKAVATTTDREWAIFKNGADLLTINLAGREDFNNLVLTTGTNRLYILTVEADVINLWVDGVQLLTDATLAGTATKTASTQVVNINARTSGSFTGTTGNQLDMFSYVSKAISESERLAIETDYKIN